MGSSLEDIQNLVNLFSLGDQNDNSDNEEERAPLLDKGPADINSPSQKSAKPQKVNPYAKIEEERIPCNELVEDPEAIDEFLPAEEDIRNDWKKTPQWNLSYRQQVTASDVFLQMGPKNTSTSSCEDMIIDIFLPGEKRQNFDLKIFARKLTLSTPNFSLDIPLPQPVDPQRGNAQWNNESEKLIVTLKMEREFDFLNF